MHLSVRFVPYLLPIACFLFVTFTHFLFVAERMSTADCATKWPPRGITKGILILNNGWSQDTICTGAGSRDSDGRPEGDASCQKSNFYSQNSAEYNLNQKYVLVRRSSVTRRVKRERAREKKSSKSSWMNVKRFNSLDNSALSSLTSSAAAQLITPTLLKLSR